ncbi:gtp binding protein [Stemphylium lycopersici]|uniref:Gtp binding protein n=1 Tax=Stemphylium lycopersici TaxID=183478 RepID=A0A364N4G4_STELY|nr:gtp binding protein [Stemphylium lycopersici]RAR11768.1 gtp binding protein [Stemphylium lycopersici]
MSRNEAVSPLRINKTPTTSPSKGSGRPLSEIGPHEQRRNSPSWNQSTKVTAAAAAVAAQPNHTTADTAQKIHLTKESSPFRDSSPFTHSPRLFWKEQTTSPKSRFDTSENEYEGSSPLSPKRNSIENLKKQSRVKNSSMFAREQKQEYDPHSVQPLDRPLAAGRPLSTAFQGNAYGGNGIQGMREENESLAKGHQHRRSESQTKIPTMSPSKTSPAKLPTQSSFASPAKSSPSEGRASPTKSSLVSNGRFNSPQYNPDSSAVMSDDEELVHQTPRPLRRHAKSVTFDTAPPQITEFEMVTPDPSVATESRDGSYDSEEETEEEMSFDQDDSFDASLEDTDKTPVVLPEDWRHMSPDAADTSLTDVYDDVFEGRDNSPMPSANPTGSRHGSRLGSVASDSDARPLPPLPGMQAQHGSRRRDSSIGLSAAAERVGDRRRSLPQLPQAAGISKHDLLNMREVSMSLEDRLRLMNFDSDRDTSTPTQESQDKKNKKVEQDAAEADVEQSELAVEEPKAPRISRESILRRVKSRNFEGDEGEDDISEEEYSHYEPEDSPERSYGDLADLDPDVPIPSREASSNFDEHPRQVSGVSEADSVLDAYGYADASINHDEHADEADETDVDGSSISQLEDYERESSVIRHPMPQECEDDDDASQYSTQAEEQPTSQSTIDSSGPPTPTVVPSSPAAEEKQAEHDDMYSNLDGKDVDLSLDPLKASMATAASPLDTAPKLDAMREFLRRPVTPDQEAQNAESESEEPGTPDSVIRHPVVQSPSPGPEEEETEEDEEDEEEEEEEEEEIEVPQREATIRGAGGSLKTRPSLIPEDIDMAATRRQVSGTYAPPVPERSPKRQSLNLEMGHVDDEDSQLSLATRENRMLDLKLGDLNLGDDSNDLSFGLDKEFDQIIATQKKGYLMRENTKVVVASSRQFSDEKPPTPTESAPEAVRKPSSRKASAERKAAWTKEPWNGKPRRKSIRTASGRRTRTSEGPAPPLPGQESAVAGGLDSVAEQAPDDQFEDGEERGRVFVKVVGVKDLDLPLPKTERVNFQLTLDNGLHCVTTSWLELNQSAPIGQEFELVVLDDLEFQLTLQTKLEPPAVPQVVAPPARIVNHKKSHSAFRNLLSSPKKRKEQERKAQEEADRIALQEQQEAQAAAKRNHQATAWDLLHDLVGPDGSFARAYVCLSNHESQAYGRPLTVDVPCFNEWAVDSTGASSVKSKRGGVVRRPPYRVGKLTLQLLYVPRPKNCKDDDMPKSMNACIRELKEAEQVKDISFEGTLSQQGGDCPYWRRRFFRLEGTKLTAFHESTRQPRATINLAKASKLMDDKSALQQPSATKTGGRRKSGFAEDEEGYMFVEEGFRIRFANGEVIDFYADSRAQKEAWMKVLSETVGKDIAQNKGWAAMVLEKERKERKERSQMGAPMVPAKSHPLTASSSVHRPNHVRTQSQDVQPAARPSPSPVKGHARTQSHAPPPPLKDVRMSHAPPPRPRTQEGAVKPNRRDQVRSMIF